MRKSETKPQRLWVESERPKVRMVTSDLQPLSHMVTAPTTSYEAALNEAAIVAVTDLRGTIIAANNKFCRISGYAEHELLGANHRLLKSGVHDRAFFQQLYRTITAGRRWHGTICNRAKDGSHYWVDTTIVPNFDATGKVEGYTAIRFDVTPLKLAEQALRRHAHFDDLTGLANRRQWFDMLNHALNAGRPMTIAMLDLDHFKQVNDTHGHAAGDRLLQGATEALSGMLRSREAIARLGGDEFALLLSGDDTRAELITRFADLPQQIAHLSNAHDCRSRTGVSIGMARFPADGESPHELMKRADLALYAAKRSGGNQCRFFEPELEAEGERLKDLREEFLTAFATGRIQVFYQPIIGLTHPHPPSFEALLRWVRADGSVTMPGAFLAVMDDDNLAREVGSFVLRTVIAQITAWNEAGIQFHSIAVNATTADLHSPVFVNEILAAIACGRIETHQLGVEITEGMLLDRQAHRVRTAIDRLHAHGVQIAFDDFGTGFASLTHLRELPIDCVKIDYSFVEALCRSEKDRVIVASVIDLAHRLGLSVVAEGVERADQHDLLLQMGCDRIQGYLISPAIPGPQAESFLRSLPTQLGDEPSAPPSDAATLSTPAE